MDSPITLTISSVVISRSRSKRVIERGNNRLFYLGAGIAIRGRGELLQVNFPGSRFRFCRWMKISRRAPFSPGRSTKKISSKRPLRRSSGGSDVTSFAGRHDKTGAVLSCSQEIKVPNTRAVVPPSLIPEDWVPANPFSNSSIQRTFGAVLSAIRMALRIFSRFDRYAAEDLADVHAK